MKTFLKHVEVPYNFINVNAHKAQHGRNTSKFTSFKHFLCTFHSEKEREKEKKKFKIHSKSS